MNYKLAMIGLSALSTVAVATPAAAMPNGLPLSVQPQNAEQVRYVCNWRARCWWQPGPHFYGAYAYGPRWHRGSIIATGAAGEQAGGTAASFGLPPQTSPAASSSAAPVPSTKSFR